MDRRVTTVGDTGDFVEAQATRVQNAQERGVRGSRGLSSKSAGLQLELGD